MSEELELTRTEKRLLQACCVCCFPVFIISLISRLIDWVGLKRKMRKKEKSWLETEIKFTVVEGYDLFTNEVVEEEPKS